MTTSPSPGPIRTVRLPGGEGVPALGQGTWKMGERAALRPDEIAALRLGIELGMTLLDTAEIYADGEAERITGAAIEGQRDRVFLVSKAHPGHAGRTSLPKACEASLRRLGTDRIDLYLLHWMGSTPLEETVAAFETLRRAGKIRHWGVSNLDTAEMAALVAAGGADCATNQILYSLEARGAEFDLLPWQAARKMPFMAYCPVLQGRAQQSGPLVEIATRHGVTPLQVALAWVLRRPDAIAIPKATRPEHVRQNRAAADLVLSADDLAALDRAYPPPVRKVALATV